MRMFHVAVITGVTGALALMGLTGCGMWEGRKARESGRTLNQYQNDIATTGRVDDALKMAPVYKFPDVHVETFQGNVQLSGFVRTDAQKREAVRIARQTPGVNQVIDNLAMVPENPTPTGRVQGYNENDQPVQNRPNETIVQPGVGTNATNTVPPPR